MCVFNNAYMQCTYKIKLPFLILNTVYYCSVELIIVASAAASFHDMTPNTANKLPIQSVDNNLKFVSPISIVVREFLTD